MTDSERSRFVIVVSALGATFQREVTEAFLEGYWIGLNDLSLPSLEWAAREAIQTCKFMPTPAELRELTGEMKPADRAFLAWDVLQRAVLRFGFYKSVDFDDRTINAAVRSLGGWMSLIERWEVEGSKWIRVEFLKTYEALARGGITEEQGKYLVGYYERHNGANGYADRIPPPVKVETGLQALPNAVRRTRLLADESHHDLLAAVGAMPDSIDEAESRAGSETSPTQEAVADPPFGSLAALPLLDCGGKRRALGHSFFVTRRKR